MSDQETHKPGEATDADLSEGDLEGVAGGMHSPEGGPAHVKPLPHASVSAAPNPTDPPPVLPLPPKPLPTT